MGGMRIFNYQTEAMNEICQPLTVNVLTVYYILNVGVRNERISAYVTDYVEKYWTVSIKRGIRCLE